MLCRGSTGLYRSLEYSVLCLCKGFGVQLQPLMSSPCDGHAITFGIARMNYKGLTLQSSQLTLGNVKCSESVSVGMHLLASGRCRETLTESMWSGLLSKEQSLFGASSR